MVYVANPLAIWLIKGLIAYAKAHPLLSSPRLIRANSSWIDLNCSQSTALPLVRNFAGLWLVYCSAATKQVSNSHSFCCGFSPAGPAISEQLNLPEGIFSSPSTSEVFSYLNELKLPTLMPQSQPKQSQWCSGATTTTKSANLQNALANVKQVTLSHFSGCACLVQSKKGGSIHLCPY